jgi:uncharacterized protein YjiS (DUF1127 family)
MITSRLHWAAAGTGAGLLAGLGRRLAAWRAEARTRTAIATLDAHLLRDIGLDPTPSDAALRRRLLIG